MDLHLDLDRLLSRLMNSELRRELLSQDLLRRLLYLHLDLNLLWLLNLDLLFLWGLLLNAGGDWTGKFKQRPSHFSAVSVNAICTRLIYHSSGSCLLELLKSFWPFGG